MKIVIIGSGNLATHLSIALKRANANIVQVYSRTKEHAEELANKLGCQAVTSLDDISENADVYVISIKDDAISYVANFLRKGRGNALIVHTAGSVPLSILNTTYPSAVLYPMQTFSKSREVDFREIPCFIEASDATSLTIVRQLADKISDNVTELSSEKRKYLHLAAVFACNMVNHCYHLAEKTLMNAGLDFNVMLPLITETAKKVSDLSPSKAQTGPMVRNDTGVMKRQMELIDDELTREIYRLMSKSIYCSSQDHN